MSEQCAESIFGQAIEIQAAEERAAFLNEVCGGDEPMLGLISGFRVQVFTL
jgi:hypothetical protein